jgi:hypothetical protein
MLLFLFATLIQLVFVTIKIPFIYALFYFTDRYLYKEWSTSSIAEMELIRGKIKMCS